MIKIMLNRLTDTKEASRNKVHFFRKLMVVRGIGSFGCRLWAPSQSTNVSAWCAVGMIWITRIGTNTPRSTYS
jgi:hypothetical protein